MDQFHKNWDSYSKAIAVRKDSPHWAVLREARESHWREFFRVGPGDKVLDAGCGNGEYTLWASQRGAKVWAFDYSAEMVADAQERVSGHGCSVERIEVASVLKIPYPDGYFDAVFCLAVLDHLCEGDREQAMRELTRVLKKGGSLYLDVPNRFAYHWRAAFEVMRLLKMYPKGKIHFFAPREVHRLVMKHGFTPLHTCGLTIGPPLSGIYTIDLQRIASFPEFLIRPLDAFYLFCEKTLRRKAFMKAFCWHYFIEARKDIS